MEYNYTAKIKDISKAPFFTNGELDIQKIGTFKLKNAYDTKIISDNEISFSLDYSIDNNCEEFHDAVFKKISEYFKEKILLIKINSIGDEIIPNESEQFYKNGEHILIHNKTYRKLLVPDNFSHKVAGRIVDEKGNVYWDLKAIEILKKVQNKTNENSNAFLNSFYHEIFFDKPSDIYLKIEIDPNGEEVSTIIDERDFYVYFQGENEWLLSKKTIDLNDDSASSLWDDDYASVDYKKLEKEYEK